LTNTETGGSLEELIRINWSEGWGLNPYPEDHNLMLRMSMYEIYVVTNKDNGKKYVGQTCQGVRQRWSQHKSVARSGVDNYFYRAIRAHGEDAFEVEVVEEIDTLEQANDAEKKWIALFESIDSKKGYNGTHGGDGSLPTDLTCAKISETRKELFKDPEFKSYMTEANTGKHHTESGKANISKALEGNQYRKGIPHDEETKKRVSESLKRAYAEGRHAPSAGLKKGTKLGPMPEETKAKIAAGVSRVRKETFWSTRKKEPIVDAAVYQPEKSEAANALAATA
jgi:group I intron endonuclease